MSLQSYLVGHRPLQFPQHLRLGHATRSSTTKLPFRPLNRDLRKQRYFSECIARAASEESVVESEDVPDVEAPPNPWLELGVDERLLPGLERNRITEPTAVQLGSIPEILSGSNVAMQCYTGSGKTLAFLLPVLSMAVQRSEEEWAAVTRKNKGEVGAVQAIIITPSRELAMQIVRVAQSLLPESARRAVQQCIGGANIWRQRDALKLFKPLLVVGTPGRLAELSREGALQTHRCRILVLDEVDQLLAPQFREEMSRLTEHTGKKCDEGRQTVIVSATLTPRVLSLCETWCPQPKTVFVGTGISNENEDQEAPEVDEVPVLGSGTAAAPSWGWGAPGSTYMPELDAGVGSAGGYGNRDAAPAIAPGLTHFYVDSAPQHRVDTLRRAIHAVGSQRALVFMNFQQRLKDAEVKLAARKMKVASLHGEMSKQERQNTLAAFKAGKYRALLVSDVAARGLDIPDCDAVFNLELPTDAAHYAHRAGRTGRAGREGVVVTVASSGEKFVVEKLGRRLGIKFSEVKLEGGDVVMAEEELEVVSDEIDDDADPEFDEELAAMRRPGPSRGARKGGARRY